MPHVELPHALEDYFAHAEMARTRDGRRFTITLPYLDDARIERFQWWWHLSGAQEQIVGSAGIAELRKQATERFRRHVERWLENTCQRLFGDGPIPHLGAARAATDAAFHGPAIVPTVIALPAEAQANVLAWPKGWVANG